MQRGAHKGEGPESVSGTPPALAVIELATIARGIVVTDALVKRADVRLLRADPITPGKHLIVFAGGVADAEESFAAGLEVAGGDLLDQLFLPFAHPAIVPALDGVSPPPIDGALGVLEMRSVASTLLATDVALKTADVRLVALHLARGIDGKGYFVFSGTLDAVEAALEAADLAVDPASRAGREVVPRPHPNLDWAVGRL